MADMAVRGKYTLLTLHDGGVAAAAEMRLPTGDEQNLLGTGAASYRFIGIGSFERGPVALLGNASVLRGGVSPEWSLAGASSIAVDPRVTLSGELLTRHVSDLHAIDVATAAHPTISGVDTLRLAAGVSATTLVHAVAGVKWNVTGTLVLGAHVTWAVAKRGLTAPVTPTIGLEYAF
jgi:hypothetical protein